MWEWYFTNLPGFCHWAIGLNFGLLGDIADVIIHAKLWKLVQGLREFWYPNFAILHRLSWWPLQQCKHYRATLWLVRATYLRPLKIGPVYAWRKAFSLEQLWSRLLSRRVSMCVIIWRTCQRVCVCWQSSVVALEQFLVALQCTVERQLSSVCTATTTTTTNSSAATAGCWDVVMALTTAAVTDNIHRDAVSLMCSCSTFDICFTVPVVSNFNVW